MGRALHDAVPVAAQIFETANDTLGFDLASLCFDGPLERLTETVNAQPGLLTCSIAALRALEESGAPPPVVVAGHSLGEFSALVAAGSLEFPDAVRLVRRRGELMENAGREAPGKMAAVLGLETEKVEEICAQAHAQSGGVVQPANFNCPGQVVISGSPEGVELASELLTAAGAKRVVPLRVSGAFHSELMQSARAQFAETLDTVPLRDARVPLVQNVSAQAVTKSEEIRKGLLNQLTSSVRWDESVRTMQQMGVSTFVEVGPGRVLSGLIRRIVPDARTLNVEDIDSLKATLTALQGT